MSNFKIALSAAVIAAVTLATSGCKPQSEHPNQISTFDGVSYDSLTAAHGALSSLRSSISANYGQYVPGFNEAAAAYSTAFSAYSLYRTNPNNQAAVAVAISNLTVSVVALENAFQSGMHVSPNAVAKARAKAQKMRDAARQTITLSDILTELEIAAQIAEAVPGTQPYSTLAAMVINATEQAIAALKSASGQLIDLSTIQPISPIQ